VNLKTLHSPKRPLPTPHSRHIYTPKRLQRYITRSTAFHGPARAHRRPPTAATLCHALLLAAAAAVPRAVPSMLMPLLAIATTIAPAAHAGAHPGGSRWLVAGGGNDTALNGSAVAANLSGAWGLAWDVGYRRFIIAESTAYRQV